MKIDLSPVLGGETDTIPFDYPLTIEEKINGAAFPNPVRVLGTVTDKAGYIALNVTLDISYEAVCDRCLKPLSRSLRLAFSRPVALAGTLQNEDSDDYLIAFDRALELDEPLIEEIVLNFPSKTLCREDCKGLCPQCGKDLNEGSCACGKKEIDPRLAGLAKFLSKNKKDE